MVAKILHWLGLTACVLLVISCFLPWTYYADINKTFTGFFSEQNQYGRPGFFLVGLGIIIFAGMLLRKAWAKRINLFLCALAVGYAIKTFILFTSCYNTYCPERQTGIYLMLIATIIMLAASIFPDLQILDREKKD